jgi:hypothetical protein
MYPPLGGPRVGLHHEEAGPDDTYVADGCYILEAQPQSREILESHLFQRERLIHQQDIFPCGRLSRSGFSPTQIGPVRSGESCLRRFNLLSSPLPRLLVTTPD